MGRFSLLVLSTLILLNTAVGTIYPEMAERLTLVALDVTEVSIYSFHSGAGPCDTC